MQLSRVVATGNGAIRSAINYLLQNASHPVILTANICSGGDDISRVVIHSDLNSCFASIELLHRPAMRDKPFAVGGDVEQRHGIILAKNDLAKRFGIKTGEVIWEAKQKCPPLVTVPPNYELYLRFSRMAREIYSDYTDQYESFGIDENWLDVTGSAGLFGSGEKIANEIRERVRFELGVTVSVGVSWNKIFAKLGSDMKKPDATTVITEDNFKQKVWPLPASDLLYVGPSTTKKLRLRCIHTIGDLANADVHYLRSFLGKNGEMLWCFANGMDSSPVAVAGKGDMESYIKSIGNSTTCPRDLTTNEDVKMAFYVLGESVASRLRDNGFEALTVQIYVRDTELVSFERQMKLKRPTGIVTELVSAAMELFVKHYRWGKPIRSIGIRSADLVPTGSCSQLSLYTDESKRQKRAMLEKTTDLLRGRFGFFTLQRALMLKDQKLSGLDAKSDHTIHPVSYA